MSAVAVLGAGSWGTTLANLLARKGETVRLWAHEPDVVETINREHGSCLAVGATVATPGRIRVDDPLVRL